MPKLAATGCSVQIAAYNLFANVLCMRNEALSGKHSSTGYHRIGRKSRCSVTSSFVVATSTWSCLPSFDIGRLCRRCGFSASRGSASLLNGSIVLTHWGLKTNDVGCGFHQRLADFGHCLAREFPERHLRPGADAPCFVPDQVSPLYLLSPDFSPISVG